MADRYVVIRSGVVVDAILANKGFRIRGATLIQSDTAHIGSTYKNGVFTDPPEIAIKPDEAQQ